ncbi:MAG: hypothetical protein QOH01_500 [Verrucomicrobiota bacterium]|jgi:hypothetical protein
MEDGRGNRYYYDAEGQLTDAYYGALDPAGNPNSWQREEHFNLDPMGNRRGWDYLATKGWQNFTRKDNGLNQYRMWSPYSRCVKRWADKGSVPYKNGQVLDTLNEGAQGDA